MIEYRGALVAEEGATGSCPATTNLHINNTGLPANIFGKHGLLMASQLEQN